MAIKLIANYSKRLGLPGYSSHQFEVSIETEIGNTSELDFAAERLYSSLQSAGRICPRCLLWLGKHIQYASSCQEADFTAA